MKYLASLLISLCLISCNKKSEETPIVENRSFPKSKSFYAHDSSFSIELSSIFQQLRFAGTDTLQTMYGSAFQDTYIMENDSLSLMISIATFNDEMFEKRPYQKVYESSMNNFLHAMNAKQTSKQVSKKKLGKVQINGERIFYALTQYGKSFYGVSEMYHVKNTLHHIAIISSKKQVFTQSDDIALAFHSYMPR